MELADSKARIAQLESKLAGHAEEQKAKEAIFEEIISKEQKRGRERELRDDLKRQQLADDHLKLKNKLYRLIDVEDESRLVEEELSNLKNEYLEFKLKTSEEKKNLEEQLGDRRRAMEKLKQELSDLTCQLSILDHKYNHAATKLATQDNQSDEVGVLQFTLKNTEAELEASLRMQESEKQRHLRERRNLEDTIEAMRLELAAANEGPSKAELTLAYEAQLDAVDSQLQWALRTVASALSNHKNLPQVPKTSTSGKNNRREVNSERVTAFLQAADGVHDTLNMNQPCSMDGGSQTQFAAGSHAAGSTCGTQVFGGGASARRKSSIHESALTGMTALTAVNDRYDDHVSFGPEQYEAFCQLRSALAELSADAQFTLIKRYTATTVANATNRFANFGDASGFPPVTDPPATLVNTIAVITTERDKLLGQCARLKRQMADMSASQTPFQGITVGSPLSGEDSLSAERKFRGPLGTSYGSNSPPTKNHSVNGVSALSHSTGGLSSGSPHMRRASTPVLPQTSSPSGVGSGMRRKKAQPISA